MRNTQHDQSTPVYRVTAALSSLPVESATIETQAAKRWRFVGTIPQTLVDEAAAAGRPFITYDLDFNTLYVSPFFECGFQNLFTVARVTRHGTFVLVDGPQNEGSPL